MTPEQAKSFPVKVRLKSQKARKAYSEPGEKLDWRKHYMGK